MKSPRVESLGEGESTILDWDDGGDGQWSPQQGQISWQGRRLNVCGGVSDMKVRCS